MAPSSSRSPPEHRREQLISYVADVMLAAQAAEARKLQTSDDFKQREAFLRRKLLMGLMLQDHARSHRHRRSAAQGL